MFLGLACAVAVFCVLVIGIECINTFCWKHEYNIHWNETLYWGCVFAAAGGSIGYIIKGAV